MPPASRRTLPDAGFGSEKHLPVFGNFFPFSFHGTFLSSLGPLGPRLENCSVGGPN
jgi:hypothetical protein